jgi:hypothetical protein
VSTPLPLDTILSDFSEDDNAWVLQDLSSKDYVIIPDDRFPGRRPIRFFMSENDAKDLLLEIVKVNAKLRGKNIAPVKVKLKTAMRGIAAGSGLNMADSFVLHSPNEVYEYIRDR